MDQKDQKAASESQTDTSAQIQDGDLEVVTGGVASGGQSGVSSPIGSTLPTKPVCITDIG